MTKPFRSALTSLVFALMVLPLLPASASAADNGDWAIDPLGGDGGGSRPSFNFTLKPDQIFRDTVVISNVTDGPLTLDIYATDAYNTPLDAGFALLEDTDTPTGVGSWIELGTDQITLEPFTKAEVPFSISIPLDARPGDHAGAIVAQNAATETEIDVDGVGIEVRRRIGARVYARVDGPLTPDLQVTQVLFEHSSALLPPLSGAGSALINYEIKNTGNTRITPTASLQVSGLGPGSDVHFDDVEIKELLPGSRVILAASFSNLPALNRLTAKVTVTGGDTSAGIATATGSSTSWVISWGYVLLVLALCIIYVVWRRLQERRNSRTAVDEPQTAADQKQVST